MQACGQFASPDDERQVLLDVSRKLDHLPGGSFAKLQHELSIGE
jgi:hypothetical protein